MAGWFRCCARRRLDPTLRAALDAELARHSRMRAEGRLLRNLYWGQGLPELEHIPASRVSLFRTQLDSLLDERPDVLLRLDQCDLERAASGTWVVGPPYAAVTWHSARRPAAEGWWLATEGLLRWLRAHRERATRLHVSARGALLAAGVEPAFYAFMSASAARDKSVFRD